MPQQPPLSPIPPMNLEEERQRFRELQIKLPIIYRAFSDRTAPRTVIVIPSASMDSDILGKVSGIHHYEERFLCLLILLRMPRVHLIFITSQPIHESIIDYYLHLLPGIPGNHARRRLTLLSCYDSSPVPLTQKILERPRLLNRIRAATVNPELSHITCFNSTPLERTLAVQLDLPLYACDPDLVDVGSKSNGRDVFRAAGVALPDGIEHLQNEQDIFDALVTLKQRDPAMRRAVVKLNEAFSGEGNALFDYELDGSLSPEEMRLKIAAELPQRIRFEAAGETWESYREKFSAMGGIVEAWIEGEHKVSPSVQCRIDPLGDIEVISTHDQILGGPSGQIYLGCVFPADAAYRLSIQAAALKIARVLKQKGVLGVWAVDFISVRENDRWHHYAIEINLRKGGTTFPFLTLQFLTDGHYHAKSGTFRLMNEQSRYYYASDNLQKAKYKGLTPDELIDSMIYHQLHFDSADQTGVVFHLMGALSEFGKFGVTCIGKTPEQARLFYDRTTAVLASETASN